MTFIVCLPCLPCFSYVTSINQQSEPLILFMEAPSLISLSVRSTSGRYDEEVISYKSVCEREVVCDVHPRNLSRQERLKKSPLPG